MVEAICAAPDDLSGDALDRLQSLVDKSLLRLDEPGTGEPRFTMLDTLREYALERLEERGTAAALRDRHLQFFAQWVEAAVAGEEFERIDAEDDNLRAALAWSTSGGSGGAGVRVAGMLWHYWERRGFFSEGRAWLERVLARGDTASAPDRALALLRLGEALAPQGDHARAVAPIEQSVQIWQALGDTAGVARGMTKLGITLRDLSDYPRATVLLEVALELHRSLGDREGIALATDMLGCLARNQGDLQRAETLLNESLALHRELGLLAGVATVLHDLGEVAQLKGETMRAASLYSQSAALYRELQIKVMLAWSLHNQAFLQLDQGDPAQALRLFQESLELFRELSTLDGTAACLAGIARIMAASGGAERAARLLGAAERSAITPSGVPPT
jgi:tetratricopeptide (TPR) repeat protein